MMNYLQFFREYQLRTLDNGDMEVWDRGCNWHRGMESGTRGYISPAFGMGGDTGKNPREYGVYGTLPGEARPVNLGYRRSFETALKLMIKWLEKE